MTRCQVRESAVLRTARIRRETDVPRLALVARRMVIVPLSTSPTEPRTARALYLVSGLGVHRDLPPLPTRRLSQTLSLTLTLTEAVNVPANTTQPEPQA